MDLNITTKKSTISYQQQYLYYNLWTSSILQYYSSVIFVSCTTTKKSPHSKYTISIGTYALPCLPFTYLKPATSIHFWVAVTCKSPELLTPEWTPRAILFQALNLKKQLEEMQCSKHTSENSWVKTLLFNFSKGCKKRNECTENMHVKTAI